MAWVQVRAIGTRPSSRRGPGVTPALYAEMSLLRNTLLEKMREEAPVNKNPNAKNRGALRRSLRASPWETDGRIWRTSFSAVDYIKYVIHETKPHLISAKPGSVLAFQWDVRGNFHASASTWLRPISYAARGGAPGRLGRVGGTSIFKAPAGYAAIGAGGTVFLTFVHHPGTQANDFVTRARDRTFAEELPGMTSRLKQALEDEIIQLVAVA